MKKYDNEVTVNRLIEANIERDYLSRTIISEGLERLDFITNGKHDYINGDGEKIYIFEDDEDLHELTKKEYIEYVYDKNINEWIMEKQQIEQHIFELISRLQ